MDARVRPVIVSAPTEVVEAREREDERRCSRRLPKDSLRESHSARLGKRAPLPWSIFLTKPSVRERTDETSRSCRKGRTTVKSSAELEWLLADALVIVNSLETDSGNVPTQRPTARPYARTPADPRKFA